MRETAESVQRGRLHRSSDVIRAKLIRLSGRYSAIRQRNDEAFAHGVRITHQSFHGRIGALAGF